MSDSLLKLLTVFLPKTQMVEPELARSTPLAEKIGRNTTESYLTSTASILTQQNSHDGFAEAVKKETPREPSAHKRRAMVKPSLPHHGPSMRNEGTVRSTLPIHGTNSIGRPTLRSEIDLG